VAWRSFVGCRPLAPASAASTTECQVLTAGQTGIQPKTSKQRRERNSRKEKRTRKASREKKQTAGNGTLTNRRATYPAGIRGVDIDLGLIVHLHLFQQLLYRALGVLPGFQGTECRSRRKEVGQSLGGTPAEVPLVRLLSHLEVGGSQG
jgi:hypothetical protein